MCVEYSDPVKADPAETLAKVLSVHLGCVHAIGVRQAIRRDWDRISKLAHAIHDETKPKKAEEPKSSMFISMKAQKLVHSERVTKRDPDGRETVTTTEFFVAE